MKTQTLLITLFVFMVFSVSLAMAETPDAYRRCNDALNPTKAGSAAFVFQDPKDQNTFYVVTSQTILKKTFVPPQSDADWAKAEKVVSSKGEQQQVVHSPIYKVDGAFTADKAPVYLSMQWTKYTSDGRLSTTPLGIYKGEDLKTGTPVPFGYVTVDTPQVRAMAAADLKKQLTAATGNYGSAPKAAYDACKAVAELKELVDSPQMHFGEPPTEQRANVVPVGFGAPYTQGQNR